MTTAMQSFQFGSSSAMLLAYFLDNYEIEKLSECVSELSEQFIGGRSTLQLSPEINLITRLLYYTISLLSWNKTPGQSLCGFDLVGYRGVQNGREVVTKLSPIDCCKISLVYSILPYLLRRKVVIYDVCKSVIQVLSSDEDNENERQSRSTFAANSGTDSSALNNSGTHIAPVPAPVLHKSFLSDIGRAVYNSVLSMAETVPERIDVAVSFGADVHRFLFLLSSRYVVSIIIITF
jgi:hypothetical protein